MAKTYTNLTALLALAVFCGCDQRALDFARKTKDILDQRSVQLTKKIAAEEKSYSDAAVRADENHRELVNLVLLNERHERASALAADYQEGHKPVSQWRKDLSEYANIDYDENRKLLTEEMDANSLYLKTLEDLQIQQDKVEALSKLLAALVKKPSLKSDITDLASFAENTKQEFDKQVCNHLLSQTKDPDPAVKASAQKAYCQKKCNAVLDLKENCPAR